MVMVERVLDTAKRGDSSARATSGGANRLSIDAAAAKCFAALRATRAPRVPHGIWQATHSALCSLLMTKRLGRGA